MAYNGYLLKIGDYTLPTNKFVRPDSYSAYVNMQDVDPWTDADGYLHREAVELKAVKVEFETPPLTNAAFTELMTNIQNNYISAKERTVNITAYIPEYDGYVTQKAYLADFTPTFYALWGDVIRYNPIRLAFIGGVA